MSSPHTHHHDSNRHYVSHHYAMVEKALLFIQQQQQQQPALSQIAHHCGMSEYQFQRIFRQWAGITPKQFLQYLTKEHCRKRLLDGDSLMESSSEAGLSGSGRLHDLMVKLEAVTPGELKSGGRGLVFFHGAHSSPFGLCFLAGTERGIHQLVFPDNDQIAEPLQQLQKQWPLAKFIADPERTKDLLQQIFAGRSQQQAPLSLWLKGSPFQFKVWEALLQIPPGRLCSYGELASRTGQPSAARAVGSAVGSNPVAILIPCHRVIQRMGAIGQYRWGAVRKQALLGWEAGSAESLAQSH